MRHRAVLLAALVAAATGTHGLDISTPWNSTLRCDLRHCEAIDEFAERVLIHGSPNSQAMILTDAVCPVPSTGQLLLYVQIQVALTALWGAFAVGLANLILRWRTRPRRWHPQRTRARTRTRYNTEKDEIFLENARGEIQPVTNLERLATYTSDLDGVDVLPSSSQIPMRMCSAYDGPNPPHEAEVEEDDELCSKRRSCFVELLSNITTVKFGSSLATAIALIPTVVQLAFGIWLRARPGGTCPHVPRIAGWFGMLGVQSTIPAQVAATLIALRPSRILAPVVAIIALGLQCLWNGSLLISLGALVGPGDAQRLGPTATAGCLTVAKLFKIAQGRIATGVLIEFFTVCATVMFAMHVRPRKRDVDERLPISRLGLTVLVIILVALQSTRAPILTAAFPDRATTVGALRCAIEARGIGAGYPFGRFTSLL